MNSMWSFLVADAMRLDDAEGAPLAPHRTDFDVEVDGPLARVKVSQRFRNETGRTVRAVYLFPLSHQGALCRLVIRHGDRVIEGVVKEKAEARRTYEGARRQGRKAALVEQRRPNLFNLEVSDVEPGDLLTVELEVEERLQIDDGRFLLTVPMTFTRRAVDPASAESDEARAVSPCYASAQRDAGGVREGWEVGLTLRASFGVALEWVRCLSHGVERDEERLEEGRVSLTLAGEGVLPDQDFVLEARARATGLIPLLRVGQGAEARPYFMLDLTPPKEVGDDRLIKREMIFVLDRSGSMGFGEGSAMSAARRGLKGCMRGLRAGDTFNVVAFDTVNEVFSGQPLTWNQNTLNYADAMLDTIESRGGTNILEAMMYALSLPADPDRMRIVVFMTDGAVYNERAILKQIEASLGQARIHAFGIGDAPNRALIEGMARAGRGHFDFMAGGQDIEEVILRFQDRIAFPVLGDVSLCFEPPIAEDVMPAPLPDLYAGQSLQIVGRLERSVPVEVTLEATSPVGRQSWSWSLSPERWEGFGRALGRQWARQRVARLEAAEVAGEASSAAIREEIVGLGEYHHLVTPHTSLVAVEDMPPEERRAEPPEMVALSKEASNAGDVLPAIDVPEAVDLMTRRLNIPTRARLVAMESAFQKQVASFQERVSSTLSDSSFPDAQRPAYDALLEDLEAGVLGSSGPFEPYQQGAVLDLGPLNALKAQAAGLISATLTQSDVDEERDAVIVALGRWLKAASVAGLAIAAESLRRKAVELEAFRAARERGDNMLKSVVSGAQAIEDVAQAVKAEEAALPAPGEPLVALSSQNIALHMLIGRLKRDAGSAPELQSLGWSVEELIAADVHDLMSRAEDPEWFLETLIFTVEGRMTEVKTRLAAVVSEKKRLRKLFEDDQTRLRMSEKKALTAVRAGQDRLAADAMAHMNKQGRTTQASRERWEAQKAVDDKLRETLRRLNAQTEEARLQKALLIRRLRPAEAQSAALERLISASSFENFGRMEEMSPEMEAEAGDAMSPHEAPLGSAAAHEQAGDPLAALKAKMGMSAAGAPTGSPRPAAPMSSMPTSSSAAAQAPTSDDDAQEQALAVASTAWERAPDDLKALLRRLGRTQSASGSWGEGGDEGVRTAFAVLSFAAAGQTHFEGRFRVQLRRARAWLMAKMGDLTPEALSLLLWAASLSKDEALTVAAQARLSEVGGSPGAPWAPQDPAVVPSVATLHALWERL